MKQLYNNLNIKSFKLISTICLLIADIGIYIYLYLKFSDKEVFQKSMKIVMANYPDAANQLTPEFEIQLYNLMINTLLTMLALVFLYHGIIYFLWNKGKKFGHSYLMFYTIIAAPGSLLIGLTTLPGNFLHGLFWIAVGLLYGFVLMGLGTFKSSKT
tara:strand:+ start:4923 stop:5393 length:471 start_codon:yes stop_codon:yes gene_type:complete